MVNLCLYKQSDRLRIVHGGGFTCNAGWQLYV